MEVLVRDFKNPYYDGPHCVCCNNVRQDVLDEVTKLLEEQDSVCADWVLEIIKKEFE